MKLIIKEYISSLRERGELDAILPDLLSQLGLNVFSRPSQGTRQNGVDVAATGSLDNGPEKVFLFSIKPRDLTRHDWNTSEPQSLRPSLDEILDSYIPNRLPAEHRDKPIVICITIGGDIREQVRSDVTGYTEKRTKDNISFEEWNGDKLATYIQSSFLREELLPERSQSRIRKSLAMLDEPEVSYRHFSELIVELAAVVAKSDAQKLIALRQMSLCLWILYSWARDAKNLESAYLAAELTLLHAWEIYKSYIALETKFAKSVESTFSTIFKTYLQISDDFISENVRPYVEKLHGISSAVRGSNQLDVTLKLFDLLGRLAISGLWIHWLHTRFPETETQLKDASLQESVKQFDDLKLLIKKNPGLLLPIKDDQATDIVLATLLLAAVGGDFPFIQNWMSEILGRAKFSYEANTKYPCVLHSYGDLLVHPKSADAEYKHRVTCASVLYPYVALWSALAGDEKAFRAVADMKNNLMPHCTFQLWYPDETSENHFYSNTDGHGATLADLQLDGSMANFLSQVFGESKESVHFANLSAITYGWWPIVLIACRHYRLPVPLGLMEGLNQSENQTDETPS